VVRTFRTAHAPRSKILVWRDALYQGPVPLSLQYWCVRNAFWKRGRELARFRSLSEVVRWFGATMVCQFSLIQLLDPTGK